jgi:hypothetical protein
MSSGDIGGMVLVDVLPMHRRRSPGGRFKKVIERNTRCRTKTYSIWTSQKDQKQLRSPSSRGKERPSRTSTRER